MTVAERLADAHQRSVALYLRLQNLEAQRQQVTQAVGLCQQALLKSDGEIEALMAVIGDSDGV